jgi:hypothetical protein
MLCFSHLFPTLGSVFIAAPRSSAAHTAPLNYGSNRIAWRATIVNVIFRRVAYPLLRVEKKGGKKRENQS